MSRDTEHFVSIPYVAPEKFTVGSLFAGIGGLELGLEMTGRFQIVWQVEQNEYCRKVLRRHWPDAIQFEDVRNVGKENLPAVDVICGGFPCQDISNAGRQAGIIAGNRSGLWYEYARIIRDLRPRYVIVENVSALLARGLDVVLGELAEIGYDAEWSMLSAEDVGAPHLRERIFIVAYAGHAGIHERRLTPNAQTQGRESRRVVRHGVSEGTQREGKALADATSHRRTERGTRDEGRDDSTPGRIRLWDEPRRDGASDRTQPADTHANGSRLEGQWKVASGTQPEIHNSRNHCGWSVEPSVGRVAHGVPRRVERLKALGNAVVPQCARVIGEWLLEIDAELGEAA